MKTNRKRALVLGLGNPLAGDDSFGLRVLERLRRNPPPAADLADAHTDLFPWIEKFQDYDLVILVDALLSEGAGRILTLGEDDLDGFSDASPSVHQISPLLALRLFRQLYPAASTRIAVVALTADSIRISFGGPAGQAIDTGVSAILSLL